MSEQEKELQAAEQLDSAVPAKGPLSEEQIVDGSIQAIKQDEENYEQPEKIDMSQRIWENAEALRVAGYGHIDMGRILLPFTVLARLEAVLGVNDNRRKVIDVVNELESVIPTEHDDKESIIMDAVSDITGYRFYNTTLITLSNLGVENKEIISNLESYIKGFSENVRSSIFNNFGFIETINDLHKKGILGVICNNFSRYVSDLLHVTDSEMSDIYEHVIRRFGSEVGQDAEDFMTPRDVVHLSSILLLAPDVERFRQNKGKHLYHLYDQTCGTGGFLSDVMSSAQVMAKGFNIDLPLIPYGQEIQPKTYAIAVGNMLLKGNVGGNNDIISNIKLGNTLTDDQLAGETFAYQCSNPPYGMKWADIERAVVDNKEDLGRFKFGLPSKNDSSMLFVQNLIEKMPPVEQGGGRGVIVLSGSPLFNGDAGSAESTIRQHIIENDLLEAVVALPNNIFYRTNIGTYIWVLTNRKSEDRKGKIQLIDASEMGVNMRKNEGSRTVLLTEEVLSHILKIFMSQEESKISKIYENHEFGYRKIKVLRPLRVSVVLNEANFATYFELKNFQKLKEEVQAKVRTFVDSKIAELKANNSVNDRGELELKMSLHDFEKEVLPKLIPGSKAKGFLKDIYNTFTVQDYRGEALSIAGEPVYDKELTDEERVPINMSVEEYMAKEVLPHAPDAVIDPKELNPDGTYGTIGYEINFNRYFYTFEQPRHPNIILADMKRLSDQVSQLLNEI